MATTTPNFGWAVPTSTDLVKDGAVAIETLGDSIDASLVDLKGGTTGQVLAKASNTDMDFTWSTDASGISPTIFAAKGDLLGASANDTPAVLTVGNNGETLVADSSTSTGLRYNPQNALVNPFINGGMDFWQRGTSFSLPATSGLIYVADRWQTLTGVNQAVTISRQATGDTTNLPNIQYCLRWQRNSGQTGTGGMGVVQSLESVNSIPYAGKTITYSFYARKGADFSGSIIAYLFTGTGTDQNRLGGAYTGGVTAINQTFTPTATWQRFTYTVTLQSSVTEFASYFLWEPSGTAGAADYVEITGVQMDLGTYTASTAPAFRRSGGTIQGELAACQRYYWRTTATGTIAVGNGTTEDANRAWIMINNPVPMRVAPTSVDASTLTVTDATSYTLDVTSVTGIVFGTNGGRVTFNTSGGQTTNRAAFGQTKSTGGYIGFNAEL
jgi:hypothetical protein